MVVPFQLIFRVFFGIHGLFFVVVFRALDENSQGFGGQNEAGEAYEAIKAVEAGNVLRPT